MGDIKLETLNAWQNEKCNKIIIQNTNLLTCLFLNSVHVKYQLQTNWASVSENQASLKSSTLYILNNIFNEIDHRSLDGITYRLCFSI